jgi:hypothetical protein
MEPEQSLVVLDPENQPNEGLTNVGELNQLYKYHIDGGGSRYLLAEWGPTLQEMTLQYDPADRHPVGLRKDHFGSEYESYHVTLMLRI